MSKIAVIETGGKQYVVAKNNVLRIESIPGSPAAGDTLKFEKVLLMDDGESLQLGKPHIKGSVVEGEFLSQGRSKKIPVIRYRQKSRYFKKRGHRQSFVMVKITRT